MTKKTVAIIGSTSLEERRERGRDAKASRANDAQAVARPGW